MNEPIIYALVAMICYAFFDFIYKQAATAGIRADHFLMAQGWLFCPLVIVYALATHTLVLDLAALWGSVAGLFVFLGFYCFIRSLATGSVSTNAAIFRLNFIVTVVLVVVVLGEPMTPGKMAGLALALLATWLLLGACAAGEHSSDGIRRQSLMLVAFATLAFGTSNFFHALGLRHGALPETLAAAQAMLFTALATVVVYVADRKLRPPPVTFTYSALAAVVLLGATISLLRSVAHGEASVLVPIAQMGFIVAALLGIFVLGERVTGRKVIGLVLGLAALAALAGS